MQAKTKKEYLLNEVKELENEVRKAQYGRIFGAIVCPIVFVFLLLMGQWLFAILLLVGVPIGAIIGHVMLEKKREQIKQRKREIDLMDLEDGSNGK